MIYALSPEQTANVSRGSLTRSNRTVVGIAWIALLATEDRRHSAYTNFSYFPTARAGLPSLCFASNAWHARPPPPIPLHICLPGLSSFCLILCVAGTLFCQTGGRTTLRRRRAAWDAGSACASTTLPPHRLHAGMRTWHATRSRTTKRVQAHTLPRAAQLCAHHLPALLLPWRSPRLSPVCVSCSIIISEPGRRTRGVQTNVIGGGSGWRTSLAGCGLLPAFSRPRHPTLWRRCLWRCNASGLAAHTERLSYQRHMNITDITRAARRRPIITPAGASPTTAPSSTYTG